ncbi:hypothetical protein EK904_009428 [Melospiza melodia maxima]|nr:hypothetical protein EK904_009428 [Melospiza melodia maxima]
MLFSFDGHAYITSTPTICKDLHTNGLGPHSAVLARSVVFSLSILQAFPFESENHQGELYNPLEGCQISHHSSHILCVHNSVVKATEDILAFLETGTSVRKEVASLAKFGVEVTSSQAYAILFSTQAPISDPSSSPAEVLQKGRSVSSLHSLSCHLMEGQCGTRVSEIWDVAGCPMCNTESLCTLPGLTAGSSSACFSSSTLDSLCTAPASPLPPRLGVEKASFRGRMGWLLFKDLEVREEPSHPSFLPIENWFCPSKSFRKIWTQLAAIVHAWPVGTHWSSDTTAFPILHLHPSTKNHCRVQAHPPHPNTSTEHVPMPPTPTVVQRSRAELFFCGFCFVLFSSHPFSSFYHLLCICFMKQNKNKIKRCSISPGLTGAFIEAWLSHQPTSQLFTSCSLSCSLAMCKIGSVLELHAPCQGLETNLHVLFPAALSFSEQVRTLLPQFLSPPRSTTIVFLEGEKSWKKVHEKQRATSMKRLCRGLYNKDIAHSMMSYPQASSGFIRIWSLKQLLGLSPPCLEGSLSRSDFERCYKVSLSPTSGWADYNFFVERSKAIALLF